MLAAAGLPLYIHLPQFAVSGLGIPLTTLGTILIAIRVFDFLQDPALGWLVDRRPAARPLFAGLASSGLALGFAMLFAVAPPIRPGIWLILSLILVFTSYSLATILVYGQSVTIGERPGSGGQFRIAGFREAGMMAGVILAAVAPSLFAAVGLDPYRALGWTLAGCALLVWAASRDLWRLSRPAPSTLSLSALHAAGGSRLLLLALANALPVALTSTLFLFFVEDRLALGGKAGVFLVLFFAAAGITAPIWSSAATRFGVRPVLVTAMLLSVAAFIGAAFLPAGQAQGFALICLASGAALGADMALLPALFSGLLSARGLPTGQAFGLWAFVSKSALALAAVVALPFLDLVGYRPGASNTAEALAALNFAYAVLPCLLKLIVITLVLKLPEKVIAT
jgi:Na+/melibiose symporter-like transporter